ncbi:MAG: acetolactate decarboxylase [Planctomycetes bacterium]|nr:acetolactate decarboxylase [Planctomycetota bacterium]MCB9903372.1 acetolactate decarboxylase [Planctomycetota bacterium]
MKILDDLFRTRTALALLLPALAGCAATSADPELRSWGELRRVLRGGEVEGRVELEAECRPGDFGLGALEGLAGEVLVRDGEAWVSRSAADGTLEPARRAQPGERATLLVLAQVDEWTEVRLPELDGLAALETAVADEARRAGVDTDRPFVFLLDGTVVDLELHVLNGACPFAQPPPPPEHMPHRARIQGRTLQLLGIYAQGAEGVLTHHGRASHVHCLSEGATPVVGHVDELHLAAGARLRLPR